MANVRISDLTAVSSLSGTEEFEVNQSGTSKKATANQIIQGGLSNAVFASNIDITTAAAGTATLNLRGNAVAAASAFALQQDASYAYVWQRLNAPILFAANNGEGMRLTAGKYFKASYDGTYVGSTSAYHELIGGDDGGWLAVLTHEGASSPYGIRLEFNAQPDNNTNYFLKCTDDADGTPVDRCIIYSDGDLQNHDNSYGAISDERLKQDVVLANSQWDDVKALQVINWRDIRDVMDKGDDAKRMIGLGAQHTETVSPGLVIESPEMESYLEQAIDEKTRLPLVGVTERKLRPTGRMIKSVQYSIAYMKAFKALQEAMERIEQLESKVASLEAR